MTEKRFKKVANKIANLEKQHMSTKISDKEREDIEEQITKLTMEVFNEAPERFAELEELIESKI